MYLLKYKIPSTDEEKITGQLQNGSTSTFSFEIVNGSTFLNIYSPNKEPADFISKEYLESITPIDIEALNNKWADDYNGAVLTDNFFVKSPDMTDAGDGFKHVILLDPVGSFGDGCHATTRLCAEMLEDLINTYQACARNNLSMLDIGTGSGILSIEASMLGLQNIDLFDCYRVSVVKSQKNLRLNGIENLAPFQDDLYSYQFTKKYDIITANLLTSVLEDNIVKMRSAIAENGHLIISGIGTRWTDEMTALINISGYKIVKHKKLEGWNGFMLSC